jgi:putative nucleotidyltransferase with HDIG domain
MDKPLPSKREAEALLLWGSEQNPGPWFQHSKTVARAAKTIAEKCGMDDDAAYILGLLHDIGRYEGPTGLRHIYSGYKLMNEKGYASNARICLTHSFPCKDIKSFNGNFDCTKDEITHIRSELKKYQYDDYDKLIQLCDSISLAEGVCVLEIRLVDVVRRYKKIPTKILSKWDAYFETKTYFDTRCGMNIYKLFQDEIIKSCIK